MDVMLFDRRGRGATESVDEYWARSEANRERVSKAKAEPTPEKALVVRERQQQATGPFMTKVEQLVRQGHTWDEILTIIQRKDPELYRAFFGEDTAPTAKREVVAIRKHVPQQEAPMTPITQILKSADGERLAADVIHAALEAEAATIRKATPISEVAALRKAYDAHPELVLQYHAAAEHGRTVAEVLESEQIVAKRRQSLGHERWDVIVNDLAKQFQRGNPEITYTAALARVRETAPAVWDAYERDQA